MMSEGPAPGGVGFSAARARVFRRAAPRACVLACRACFLVAIVVVSGVRGRLVVCFSAPRARVLFSYGGVEVFWWLLSGM